jgi:hypothetical protein
LKRCRDIGESFSEQSHQYSDLLIAALTAQPRWRRKPW